MTLQERVDELVAKHGSLRAVSRVTEIDVGYLSRLCSGGKMNPGAAILRRLGLRRVVSYERLKPPNVALSGPRERRRSAPADEGPLQCRVGRP